MPIKREPSAFVFEPGSQDLTFPSYTDLSARPTPSHYDRWRAYESLKATVQARQIRPPSVPVGRAPILKLKLPVPASPEPVPRTELPSVLLDKIPGGDVDLLDETISMPSGIFVSVDPAHPGRYTLTQDGVVIHRNVSAAFVKSLGLHTPGYRPELTVEEDEVGFDLGDFLLETGKEAARVMLPRFLEEATGLTPEAGLPVPTRVPTGPMTAPVRGNGMTMNTEGDVYIDKPPPGARGGTYVFRNGRWQKVRRRRRRKLLTEGDFNSLLKIQTLKNTDNIKIALSKALR